jgi:hypothetical protein
LLRIPHCITALIRLILLALVRWGAMKARQLIADATFDPTQLKAIRKAFDDAWEQIAPQISQRPDAIEASRLKLASIVLSVAKRGTLDSKQLAEDAMKLMFTPPTELGCS